MDILAIKQRFGIIGTSSLLDRAIDIARQVASTDLSVLITGESGSGKEVFPQIIHHLSARKHGPYIAVNCGAIPEGTIDSELFGHEKGSFTGATDQRKGYFEVANGGTIFLDEVAELPLQTQVRLLRVLETGEFIKVGSSKVIKTNVRIVAATNMEVSYAISQGKFREDLYYRLNTVPIRVPALRERKEDIPLMFIRFASDFAEKYRIPPITLDESAVELLMEYRWKGNVRQLKNVTEQASVIEKTRVLTAEDISKYLISETSHNLPVLFPRESQPELSEREILYKVLFDMKKDITELKKSVLEIIGQADFSGRMDWEKRDGIIKTLYPDPDFQEVIHEESGSTKFRPDTRKEPIDHPIVIEESLSIQDREKELIVKALERHKSKRKNAASELGISERTLYRKIKEYNIKS
ncbi:MAG: sigma-54 dependent transcriptional regulator [Bacteroidetes bacterium]|nr:sigma-54 dependent transcriptional regulator [Bacteroidota bacterium]